MRQRICHRDRSQNNVPAGLELAAQDARVRVPVAATCRVLGFSRLAFYQWRANPVTDREWSDAHLINAA